MPGSAKTILISCANNHSPNSPCEPNNKINTKPAITGETAKGKSTIVSNRFFPLKLNFVSAHAAITPKIALRGTVMATTINVSLIAANASGCVIAVK